MEGKTLSEKERYESYCKKHSLQVSSMYVKNITNKSINLSRQGISIQCLRGIAHSLKFNATIRELDLTENNLQPDSVKLLADVFVQNDFITKLNLSSNKLDNPGAKYILSALTDSDCLAYLNLSDNCLDDRSIRYIRQFLIQNRSVEELILSHNGLGETCDAELKVAIEINTTIKVLDLSWNHYRLNAGEDIVKGIGKNRSIKSLNISWNGIDNRIMASLNKSLLRNSTLIELDLSNNRITDQGVIYLADALSGNRALETLILSGNTIGTEAIQQILEACLKNEHSALRQLNLGKINVSEANLVLIQKLQYFKSRGYHVTCGVLLKTKTVQREINLNKILVDSLDRFKRFLIMNKVRALDLFNKWDKDKLYFMSREEFRCGMRTSLPEFDELQIDLLVLWLDPNNSDQIGYKDFVRMVGEREQRRLSLIPPSRHSIISIDGLDDIMKSHLS